MTKEKEKLREEILTMKSTVDANAFSTFISQILISDDTLIIQSIYYTNTQK